MIPDDKSVTELSAEEQANVVKTALSSGQGGKAHSTSNFPISEVFKAVNLKGTI